MPPSNVPQSTIDKITEQIVAKIMPVLDDVISRAAASAIDAVLVPSPISEIPSLAKVNIDAAHYIWTGELPYDNPANGIRGFRHVVTLPEGQMVDSMLIAISCNGIGNLYVNGSVLGGTNSANVDHYSIKFPLTDRIVIVVAAMRQEQVPGLIASAVVWNSRNYKGRTFASSTDTNWETSTTASGFHMLDYTPDSSWNHAYVQGPSNWAFAKISDLGKKYTTLSEGYLQYGLEKFGAPMATSGPSITSKDIL